jgi:hypothetical protein
MEPMGGRGTVIITAAHPLYTNPFGQGADNTRSMALVVWYLHDERRFSFDALAWVQELPGSLMPSTPAERKAALRHALHEGQQ